MKLSTKLFLFVGLLLFLICLGIFLVPDYILKRNVAAEKERFLRDYLAERIDDQTHYLTWVRDGLAEAEGVIDAFFFLLSGHDEVASPVVPKGKEATNVWLTSSKLMTYSDWLDFTQISQGDQAAAITLSRSQLHVAKMRPIDDHLAWIETALLPEGTEKRILLGVWLPTISKEANELPILPEQSVPETYLTYDPISVYTAGDAYKTILAAHPGPKEAGNEQLAVNLLERLQKAQGYLIKKYGEPSKEGVAKLKADLGNYDVEFPPSGDDERFPPYLREFLSSVVRKPESYVAKKARSSEVVSQLEERFAEDVFFDQFLYEVERANELEMMGALGLLATTDIAYTSPTQKEAPVGAARIIGDMNMGTAVYSAEAFSDQPLFDSAGLYAKWPPVNNKFNVSSGSGLADAEKVGAVTLTNVMRFETGIEGEPPVYMALGISLGRLSDHLAEISGYPVFTVHNGLVKREAGPSLGIDRDVLWQDIDRHSADFKAHGIMELAGTDFFYYRYNLYPDWDFYFLSLIPAKVLFAPAKAFEDRSKRLTSEIIHHVIAVALGIFIVGLLILEILARHFTKPIAILAVATEKVAQGQFEGLELPDVKEGSKNEVSVLTGAFKQMVKGLADREKLRSILDKVVSPEIAEEILSGKVQLGGETKEVTVLFADVRNFTGLSERLPPEEVVEFINEFMTFATRIIESHQGVIDKYIGDEVMALYGAPVEHKFSALQAILSALMLQREVVEWNERRETEGKFPIQIGIGLHTGFMIAGNMGAEDRLNYTVMGAEVNLASRLCDKAAPGEILIVQKMLDRPQIADTVRTEYKDDILFKGLSEPIPVYRVVGLQHETLLGQLTQYVRKFGPEAEDLPDSPADE